MTNDWNGLRKTFPNITIRQSGRNVFKYGFLSLHLVESKSTRVDLEALYICLWCVCVCVCVCVLRAKPVAVMSIQPHPCFEISRVNQLGGRSWANWLRYAYKQAKQSRGQQTTPHRPNPPGLPVSVADVSLDGSHARLCLQCLRLLL